MYAELERKVCTKCNETKGQNEFSKRSTRPSGKASWCKTCLNEWRRAYRLQSPEKFKNYEFSRGLRRNYRISVEDYARMLQSQNECCACCGKHQSAFKRRLHVDHDHETGEVRFLLCTECNPGLGYFKHSIDRLKMAICYLEKLKN